MSITFKVSLVAQDWDERLGGWRCDALLIPSSEITAIYYAGKKADTNQYSLERDIIRWSNIQRPKEIVVEISLTKDLSKLEEEKLQLEQQKLQLEQQKFRSDVRWKKITAASTTLSFLITIGVTHFLGYLKLNPHKSFSQSLQATIDSLVVTREVQRSENVEGQIVGEIPSEKSLWFYIYSSGNQRYYYYPITVTQQSWKVPRNVFFGENSQPAEGKFTVGVVAVDSQVNEQLKENPNDRNKRFGELLSKELIVARKK